MNGILKIGALNIGPKQKNSLNICKIIKSANFNISNRLKNQRRSGSALVLIFAGKDIIVPASAGFPSLPPPVPAPYW